METELRPVLDHGGADNYLHLWREVILTYRKLMHQVVWHTPFTASQFEILREIAVAGGTSTVSALARELDLDPAAVTRTCAELTRLGLVQREGDSRDARRKPVVLTDIGSQQMAEMHALLHEREAALADGGLDLNSIETTVAVLRAMRLGVDTASFRS